MAIKKGDFIRLEYTGRTAEDNAVFDTTSDEVAKAEHLHVHKPLKAVVVCVGEGHVLPGLDKRLEGAELGKHSFLIPDVEAFGKKDAKLLQLVPRKVFKEQQVQPVPGLEIDVDNQRGIIRTVSGGRVIVDFNHPLASHDLVYEVDVKEVVIDDRERIIALLSMIGLPVKEVKVDGKKAEVVLAQPLPANLVEVFVKDIVRLTGVDDVVFAPGKEEKQ